MKKQETKKIIILILIVLLAVGVYWFYTNNATKITDNAVVNNQNQEKIGVEKEVGLENVIDDMDTLEQDEKEINLAIEKLENTKF